MPARQMHQQLPDIMDAKNLKLFNMHPSHAGKIMDWCVERHAHWAGPSPSGLLWLGP